MSHNRDYFQLTAHQRPMTGDTKTSVLLTDHLGWLLCDGRLLNITDYPFLFGAIHYAFGSNISGTQFQLPNPAGRVPGFIGSGSNLTPRRMGSNFGTETHTLTVAEMPTHAHTIADPGHSHTGTTNAGGQGVNVQNIFASDTPVAINAADDGGSHTHAFTTQPATTGITINNNGGSNAHNNMQPTLFLGNLFIYSGKFGKFSGALRTRYPFDSSGFPYITSNYIV
jgi:microcystin-dependent protein